MAIHLRTIPDEERRPEDDLVADFEAVRPKIFGALLDGVSAGLRNLPSVKLVSAPRLADFTKFMKAAEPGLGWEPGTFERAYRENRRDVTESSFEADLVAVAIRDFMQMRGPDGFEGTATQLLSALNGVGVVSEGIKNSRSWPTTPQGLGQRFERAAPLLRGKGFVVGRKHSGERTITIKRPQNP